MILRRHVFSKMLSRSLFVLLASALLYLVVDVMSIAQHLGRGSASQIARLYFLRSPQMLMQVLPIALVLGPLLALGSLAKRHELAAIKFCGGRVSRIIAPPALIIALGAALGSAALSEWVLPKQVARATSLQDRVFHLRGPRFWNFYTPRRWMRSPQGFVRVGQLRGGEGRNIIYLQHDSNYQPKLLIQAERLHREGQDYWLSDARVQRLDRPDQIPKHFERLLFPEPMAPGSLEQRLGFPEVFTFSQLQVLAQRRAQQGASVQPFTLAMWRRIGDPLLLFVLMLLVIPVSAWAGRGQATELRIIQGAGILGLYFLSRGLFAGLASSDHLRCALAALLPSFSVVILAALLWTRIEHEGFSWPRRRLLAGMSAPRGDVKGAAQ